MNDHWNVALDEEAPEDNMSDEEDNIAIDVVAVDVDDVDAVDAVDDDDDWFDDDDMDDLIIDSEFRSLQDKHTKSGYVEGVNAGNEYITQEAFDTGFVLSCQVQAHAARYRGELSAILLYAQQRFNLDSFVLEQLELLVSELELLENMDEQHISQVRTRYLDGIDGSKTGATTVAGRAGTASTTAEASTVNDISDLFDGLSRPHNQPDIPDAVAANGNANNIHASAAAAAGETFHTSATLPGETFHAASSGCCNTRNASPTTSCCQADTASPSNNSCLATADISTSQPSCCSTKHTASSLALIPALAPVPATAPVPVQQLNELKTLIADNQAALRAKLRDTVGKAERIFQTMPIPGLAFTEGTNGKK